MELPIRQGQYLALGIQGYLKSEKKISLDLLKSADFELFRQVLDARMKDLTRGGSIPPPRQAEAFTAEEEDRFWTTRLLGDHNPKVLLRTMVFLNGKHFALRSGTEHRQLRYQHSQITLHENSDTSFLEYTEDVSKTNQGGLRHSRVKNKSTRIYAAANSERCHIRLYQLYMSLCPKSGRDSAFYLGPLLHPTNDKWFSRQPVGHNTLQKMVPDLSKEAGLKGHYTNHSLKATAATHLYQEGIEEQLIMGQTGHRSVAGVRSYKRPSEQQIMAVSSVLNGDKKPRTSTGDAQQVKGEGNTIRPVVDRTFTFNNCTVNFH